MRILECFDGPDVRPDSLRQRGGSRFADSIDGEDGRAIEAGRKIRGSGVRQMMRHEMQSVPERASKKVFDGTPHLTESQPKGLLAPRIPPFGAISHSAHLRIKRVCNMIDIAGVEFGMVQAKPDCAFRELMRVIEFSLLAVLDAIESLLLGRGDELVVDEQRSGGLVIHRVDSKDVQLPPPV